MNVQPPTRVQTFVEEKVKAGEYGSTNDLVEAGIARLMLDPPPQLDEDTLQPLEEGEAQGDRGEVRSWQRLKADLLGKYLGN